MPPSKIRTDLIAQYFASHAEDVFRAADLENLFSQKFHEWNLPPSMTPHTFNQMLLTRRHLEKIHLRSKHYSSLLLYNWKGAATPFTVALSLQSNQSFFSHASAMWIHGLSENNKQIFINKEQSPKQTRPSSLSQESIDRAFQNQQRRSKMAYRYKGSTITLLNGKNTRGADIETTKAPTGQEVGVTSKERTLIDITVRPAYSGGVAQILEAYKRARGQISVQNMLNLLQTFDYAYPYHQSVGFYLTRAQYNQEDQQLLKTREVKFNFYLSHALRNPAFDPEWKIYFPQSLK
jgi:hypothetical protein